LTQWQTDCKAFQSPALHIAKPLAAKLRKKMNEKELLEDIRYLLKNTPILYQYMSINGGRPFLENLKLMLKNPTIFNDPYDFYKGLVSFDKIPKEFLEELIKKKESYKNLTENEIRKAFVDIAYPKQINQQGVSCFSEDGENMLMWSHYSNKHTGVVIGYNYQSVQDCVGKIAGSDVDYRIHPNKLRTGEYAGEIHEILESEYSTRKLFTKHPSWAYEQEYRLLTTESNGGRFSIPKKCICELYLGCNIDEDIKNALLNIVNDLDIDIYDMVKTSNTDLIRQKVVKQKTR